MFMRTLGGKCGRASAAAMLAAGLLGVAAIPAVASSSVTASFPSQAIAWGSDSSGQLGVAGPLRVERNSPVPVANITNAVQLAAGGNHSLAVLADGTVQAWGANDSGQLGTESSLASSVEHDTPAPALGITNARQVAAGAGGSHSLARLADGTVMAWGNNTSGQLGIGTTSQGETPPVAVTGLSDVASVAAGNNHNLALLIDGTVMAWGDNTNGQLGDGTTTSHSTPTPVPGLSSVVAVAADGFSDGNGGPGGSNHSLALLADGTVKAWGDNTFGQLGDGTTVQRNSPVTVVKAANNAPLVGIKAIDAGEIWSLALMSNGTARAWGDDSSGELGNGNATGPGQSPLPVRVRGVAGATQIAAGGLFGLAVTTSGAVYSWGDNNSAELGRGYFGFPPPGSANCSCEPVASRVVPPGQLGVQAIAAGGQHSLALRINRTSVALTSSPNPSTVGQAVTFTAKVRAPGGVIPTGTVTFKDGGMVLGSSPVDASGKATFTTSSLSVGNHVITATYTPADTTFAPSTSPPLIQRVYDLIITGSQSVILVPAGQSVLVDHATALSVVVRAGGALTITNSTVVGSVASTGATSFTACDNAIGGSLSVTGSTGFVTVGDGGDDGPPGCAGNRVSTVSLNSNHAGLEVAGNEVGTVVVSSNTGSGPDPENASPEIEGNNILSSLACVANTPAPTDGGQPNSGPAPYVGQCSGFSRV